MKAFYRISQWLNQWTSPQIWLLIVLLLTLGSIWLTWLYPLYRK
jgi:hypothetical protein